MTKPEVILLDVEGTTTPIDFVYGTLFPYVRSHLPTYLQGGIEEADLHLLAQEYAQETSTEKPSWQMPPLAYLLWLMDQDRKSPALKSIQGKIWESGYQDGSLQGLVFPDVKRALQEWQKQGIRICIYSSGSVLAQKLLFRYSSVGDLSPWLSGYFDTGVGAKQEVASYKRIVETLGVAPAKCLFISDSVAECEAASRAGLQVLHSLRPGNQPQSSSFPTVSSFVNVWPLECTG
jgi:enolase-phosphatase E1